MQPQHSNDAPRMTRAQRAGEARRLRDRFTWLNNFTDEEIQQISFCESGAEMVPGDSYFDISYPENGPFVGQAGQRIPTGGCLVRQSSVPPAIWAKLISYPSRR